MRFILRGCWLAFLSICTSHAASAGALSQQAALVVEGSYQDAVLEGGYLYLVKRKAEPGEADIEIYSADGDDGIKRIGVYRAKQGAQSIASRTGYLLLANGHGGVEVVDISQPENPLKVGQLSLAGYLHKILLNRDRAYVAAGFAGLHILDVSNPLEIKRISSFQAYQPPDPAVISGESAEDADGMLFEQQGERPGGEISNGDAAEMMGGYFSADDLMPYEGEEPGISFEELSRSEGVLDLVVNGETVFLAYGSAGVVVVDIGDISRPVKLSETATRRPAERVALNQTTLFVATGVAGVSGWDVADPGSPKVISEIRTPCYPRDLAVFSSSLFIADGYCGLDGLLMYDVTDPASPQVSQSRAGLIGDVRIDGDHLFAFGLIKASGFRLYR